MALLQKNSGTRSGPARPPQVIVITGATAGVGRAVALRFAKTGARLGLISRDAEALAALAQELTDLGATAATEALDVSDAEAVKRAAERFEHELGPIDVWINDAMLTVFSPISEMTPEEFRRVTEVTYLGFVHGVMAALALMRKRGSGHIINIGSALAYRGIPLQSAYCGAKHAIRGFTGSLRSELEHDGSAIKVSILELPAMNTPQFDWARTHMPRPPRPMGKIYQPEVAAQAVYRAVQTGAREYWVGLSTLLTIVGNMIAPEFLDWYLARTAVEGQERKRPINPNRKDNLFAPITKLHRTHGAFDAQASDTALTVSGMGARAVIVGAGALVFFLIGALSAGSAKPRREILG